jgi:hypothetical protein
MIRHETPASETVPRTDPSYRSVAATRTLWAGLPTSFWASLPTGPRSEGR